jgi:hypothetical protein
LFLTFTCASWKFLCLVWWNVYSCPLPFYCFFLFVCLFWDRVSLWYLRLSLNSTSFCFSPMVLGLQVWTTMPSFSCSFLIIIFFYWVIGTFKYFGYWHLIECAVCKCFLSFHRLPFHFVDYFFCRNF